MKCGGCERELLKREHAQPMQIQGFRAWPKSLCDDCCRANLTTPSSQEALERLVTGKRKDAAGLATDQ